MQLRARACVRHAHVQKRAHKSRTFDGAASLSDCDARDTCSVAAASCRSRQGILGYSNTIGPIDAAGQPRTWSAQMYVICAEVRVVPFACFGSPTVARQPHVLAQVGDRDPLPWVLSEQPIKQILQRGIHLQCELQAHTAVCVRPCVSVSVRHTGKRAHAELPNGLCPRQY